MTNDTLPSWFLAHGAPFHALGDHHFSRFWAGLPKQLRHPPKAILCISAHWEASQPTLSGHVEHPAIQHDYYGFPDELYGIRWPLPDGRATGDWLLDQLQQSGVDVAEEAERPFDHGVWIALSRAWPSMSIPLFQLSLTTHWGGHDYLLLGKKLAQLRNQGVLLIGSGSVTHNLREVNMHAKAGVADNWAEKFVDALEIAMAECDSSALANPWQLPNGKRALPTMEHYWPLLPIIGMSDKPLTPMLKEWMYGSLAMHSYMGGQ